MIKWIIVLLSVCLNVTSGTFDYYNFEAHSLMGKKPLTFKTYTRRN